MLDTVPLGRAFALKSIETKGVAEAKVDILCRIGVPKEMLSDMGSQFTLDMEQIKVCTEFFTCTELFKIT